MAKRNGFAFGATFDWAAIKVELETGDYEEDVENPGTEVARVWLGTTFGCTPSGKIYQPFACSNVAGDCKACGGSGTLSPRTGKRARARAKRRTRDFSYGTVARGFAPNCPAYVARVARARARAERAASLTCHACDGLGSVSAARDVRWTEALEAAAASIDAFVDYFDDSIFIARSRDAEASDDVEDDAA